MKAMCQAAWLLTVAAGNFVVIIVAESSIFENRVRCEFSLCAMSMYVCCHCCRVYERFINHDHEVHV